MVLHSDATWLKYQHYPDNCKQWQKDLDDYNWKWLFEQVDTKTFENAADNGNLDNMKWLKKNNCPWNKYTFIDAALHGNLDNMKWLKENNCPWDEVTFTYAPLHGNLDNMKWLKDNLKN